MIVTRAPLRIPLGGGGTDLPSYYGKYEGFILSAAIDKFVFIHLNKLHVDDTYRLKYSQAEVARTVDEIRHPLLREALRFTGVRSGIEIASMADVPAGTGMGSSSCFLVAALSALHALKRESIPTQLLAEEAYGIEVEKARQPVGKQDHYLASFGGLTCLEINRDGKVTVTPLSISLSDFEDLRHNILLFFTGIERRSFDILAAQKADTDNGNEAVVDSLHRTKELGYRIKDVLETGNLDHFGRLLDEHWQNKKRRSSEISNPQVERWYQMARESGALGGKLMGAGGGGFLMFYCPNNHKVGLRQAMRSEGLREMAFDFDLEGAKVMVNF
ncbi:MAG: galactokinase [Chloroflexi bacterium]|nr:galactokinase [Chloroflexota bacterium]